MVVLKGRLAVVQEDFWHQQKEVIYIMPGEIFGENYASAGNKTLPVSIKAAEKSEVTVFRLQAFSYLLYHGMPISQHDGS